MALSRKGVNVSIATWKRKLKYRQGRLTYHKKKRNTRSIIKWDELVKEAERKLTKRRAELQVYRDKDKKITSMDKKGQSFLIDSEGIRTIPYNDSVSNSTIGIGHLIHLGPVTPADRKKYAGFNYNDAVNLFKKDLLVYEEAVAKVVSQSKVPVNQNMFNAMTSLCYNVGTSGFANSTVAKELKKGNKQKAADAFLLWNKPAILETRRIRERKLFLS